MVNTQQEEETHRATNLPAHEEGTKEESMALISIGTWLARERSALSRDVSPCERLTMTLQYIAASFHSQGMSQPMLARARHATGKER